MGTIYRVEQSKKEVDNSRWNHITEKMDVAKRKLDKTYYNLMIGYNYKDAEPRFEFKNMDPTVFINLILDMMDQLTKDDFERLLKIQEAKKE